MSNLEKVYKELKAEYNEFKIKHEDIVSQYKSSIQSLTDSNEKFKNDKHNLSMEYNQLKQEYSKLQTDSVNFKEKTIEKLKDLEFLNIQYDKLKKEYEKLKEEKTNNQYDPSNNNTNNTQNNNNSTSSNNSSNSKYIIDDLKKKLNSTLEENINLQTDYENFKNAMEEGLQRKEEELEEAKNDIASKDKMIIQITKHRDFLLTTLYTAQDNFNDLNDSANIYNHPLTQAKNESVRSIKSIHNRVPDKFIDIYSRSFIDNEAQIEGVHSFMKNSSKDDDLSSNTEPKSKKYSEDLMTFKSSNVLGNANTPNSHPNANPNRNNNNNNQGSAENIFFNKKMSANMFKWYKEREMKGSLIEGDNSNPNDLDGDEDREFLQNKMAIELKSILEERRCYILNTMTFENYSFDILANSSSRIQTNSSDNVNNINNENINTHMASNSYNNTCKGMKEQKLAENIDEIILKIQQKKERLLSQKKIVENKLEKQGVKFN